jgi:UDP-N-acetylmuramate dehydrogenase
MEFSLPNLQRDVPLAPYTTFNIGGPAKYFVVVTTADEFVVALHAAQAAQLPVFILGGGSDIIVSDAGFPGLVIKSELRDVMIDDQTGLVTAGSGVMMATLIPDN